MNRPGPQPIRNIPNNVFQNQQPSASRGGPSSGRLQNGKLGNAPNWAFGVGAAGTPGLPNPQARNNASLSSFAQTIGGSQSQAQLDPSEFPSLSGAPQSQQQSSAAGAIWGNAGLRAPQNPLGQRSQQSSQTIQPPSQNPRLQQRQGEAGKDPHSPFPQLGSSIDDFRFGQGSGGLVSRSLDQHGSVDEFPPLGGLGVSDAGPVRRTGSGNEQHSNGAANGGAFGQGSDRMFSYVDGSSRATPMSRSPLDHIEQDGIHRPDQNSGGRASQNSGQTGYPLSQTQSNQLAYRTSGQLGDQQQPRYAPQHQQSDSLQGLPTDARPVESNSLLQMSEIDRNGLSGLMELLKGNVSSDQAALAQGMDLNSLGLDLHRPDNSPLHVDWAGPFADPQGRPIIPEFTLPQAYTVTNVPPLHSRIGSFSDDTLFMIFYQNPRDEAQELAAQELYKRDWRWHKKLQSWMMKATELPEPQVAPSRTEERGWYYFWDANNWRRERKEFILSYEHLHHPISQQTAEEAFAPRS